MRRSGKIYVQSFLFRWSLRLNFECRMQKRKSISLRSCCLNRKIWLLQCMHIFEQGKKDLRFEFEIIFWLSFPCLLLLLHFPHLKTFLFWKLALFENLPFLAHVLIKAGKILQFEFRTVCWLCFLTLSLFGTFHIWTLSLFGTFHIWKLFLFGTFHIWHFLAVLRAFSPNCLFTPSLCKTWLKPQN